MAGTAAAMAAAMGPITDLCRIGDMAAVMAAATATAATGAEGREANGEGISPSICIRIIGLWGHFGYPNKRITMHQVYAVTSGGRNETI